MSALKLFPLLAATVTLAACVQPVWDRPGTTLAQANIDNAQCQLVAEGANPDPSVSTIDTGHLRQDIVANALAGFFHGVPQGAAVEYTRDLCMQAKGYAAVTRGTSPPSAVAAASDPLIPTGPAVGTAFPPPPSTAAVRAPTLAENILGSATDCPPSSDPRWLRAETQAEARLLCNPFLRCVLDGVCHRLYAG